VNGQWLHWGWSRMHKSVGVLPTRDTRVSHISLGTFTNAIDAGKVGSLVVGLG
jgi:hypothetical protein